MRSNNPSPDKPGAQAGQSFTRVLAQAIGRAKRADEPSLPRWAARAGKSSRLTDLRLQRWLFSTFDLALDDVVGPLSEALGCGARLLLVQDKQGAWHLIDCSEGVATLWSGEGDGVLPVSHLDPSAIVRILAMNPAPQITHLERSEQGGGIASLLRRYRARFIELMLTGVFVNAVGLLLPLFTMLIYDKVVGNGAFETLWALSIGLAIAAALDLVLRIARTHTVESVASRIDASMERGLLERLLAADGPMPPIGVMLARYRDFQASREFVSSTWLLAMADAPFIAVFLIAIGLVAGPLVWIPVAAGAILLISHGGLHMAAMRPTEAAISAQAHKTTALAEVLGAGEVVRATPLRHALSRRFNQQAGRGAAAVAGARYWTHIGQHVTAVVIMLCAVGVLLVGVYRIEARELTIGGLIACSMLSSRVVMMMAGLSAIIVRARDLQRAMRGVYALLGESQQREVIDPGSAQWTTEAHNIQVRGLSFGHRGARQLLTGLDLDIPAGQFVAVLGRPGAGKSTLLKLVGGLWRPLAGDVLLGGHAIAEWPVQVREARVSIKPQDPVLFEGTLAENIVAGADALVRPEAFSEALAVTGLDQTIAKAELSLSQRLVPGGTNLSGGQRQLIALTRALAIDASLVLLDEPTVGLDQVSETAIVERLRRWGQGRTVLVATHSAAVVAVADRVIVLDNGKVVADGRPSHVLGAGKSGRIDPAPSGQPPLKPLKPQAA